MPCHDQINALHFCQSYPTITRIWPNYSCVEGTFRKKLPAAIVLGNHSIILLKILLSPGPRNQIPISLSFSQCPHSTRDTCKGQIIWIHLIWVMWLAWEDWIDHVTELSLKNQSFLGPSAKTTKKNNTSAGYLNHTQGESTNTKLTKGHREQEAKNGEWKRFNKHKDVPGVTRSSCVCLPSWELFEWRKVFYFAFNLLYLLDVPLGKRDLTIYNHYLETLKCISLPEKKCDQNETKIS